MKLNYHVNYHEVTYLFVEPRLADRFFLIRELTISFTATVTCDWPFVLSMSSNASVMLVKLEDL